MLPSFWIPIALMTALSGQSPPSEVYRSPDQLEQLPAGIRERLDKLECRIPQSASGRNNVIQGEFTRPGQQDVAVVCSDGERSRILVFWGGPSSCPSELAEEEERRFLYQTGPGGKWEYYRSLAPVDLGYIVDHYEAYGGTTPPPINHEGINDAFEEKASVVHYCYEGKWLELTGAD